MMVNVAKANSTKPNAFEKARTYHSPEVITSEFENEKKILICPDGSIDAGVYVTIDENNSTHVDEPNRNQVCVEVKNDKPIGQQVHIDAESNPQMFKRRAESCMT